MFLRYCPPTSNMLWVSCPKEQYLVAVIKTSNKFSFCIAAWRILFKLSCILSGLIWCNCSNILIWYSFSSLVARMTQFLALSPESRVLEVGTGSGYQAAVLAEIVREVYTVEIIAPLAREAAARLAALGYVKVAVRAGDGYAGWPEAAPFDAIIVTCAPDRIPPPLREQLKPGGRLCIPVGPTGGEQELRLLEKTAEGALVLRAVLPVRFVPMTGRVAAPP